MRTKERSGFATSKATRRVVLRNVLRAVPLMIPRLTLPRGAEEELRQSPHLPPDFLQESDAHPRPCREENHRRGIAELEEDPKPEALDPGPSEAIDHPAGQDRSHSI